MRRIALAAVTLFLSAVTSSFSQTNDTDNSGPKIWDSGKQAWVKWNGTNGKSQSGYKDSSGSLTPDAGDWTLSIGGVFAHGTIDLPKVPFKTTGNAGGGFIAADYFVTKAVSLRGEFVIVHRDSTLDFGAGPFPASITEYALDVGAKFYPLQLSNAKDFRLQPYLRLAFGGIFYDLTAPGVTVNVDPSMLGVAGGGVDVVLSQSWAVTVEADYYNTLADSSGSVLGASTTYRQYGFLATAGLRFNFSGPMPYHHPFGQH